MPSPRRDNGLGVERRPGCLARTDTMETLMAEPFDECVVWSNDGCPCRRDVVPGPDKERLGPGPHAIALLGLGQDRCDLLVVRLQVLAVAEDVIANQGEPRAVGGVVRLLEVQRDRRLALRGDLVDRQ